MKKGRKKTILVKKSMLAEILGEMLARLAGALENS